MFSAVAGGLSVAESPPAPAGASGEVLRPGLEWLPPWWLPTGVLLPVELAPPTGVAVSPLTGVVPPRAPLELSVGAGAAVAGSGALGGAAGAVVAGAGAIAEGWTTTGGAGLMGAGAPPPPAARCREA